MGRAGGGVAARVAGGGTVARAGGTLFGLVEICVVPEAWAVAGSLPTTLEFPLDGVAGDSLALRASLAGAAFVDEGAADAAGLDGPLLLLT
jgi:hypothetical protein